MTKARLWLSAKRWIDLACCGIISGTIVSTLEPLLRATRASLAEHFNARGLGFSITILALALFASCWPFARGRLHAFLGIPCFFQFPPLWIAMLVGTVTWSSTQSTYIQPLEFVDPAVCDTWSLAWTLHLSIIVLALAASASLLCGSLFNRPISRTPQPVAAVPFDKTKFPRQAFDELRRWLLNDVEISTPTEDRFGHDEVARRIASRLSNYEEAPTIAVVGRFGSGKSTLRTLVTYHLRNYPSTRIVAVSLWPFDSAEAAVHGIIGALTRELGRYVNILSVSGLSDEYVRAVEATSGMYGGIAHLVRAPTSPSRIIQQLSDIACAAGIRIVLWIEDFERFTAPEPANTSAHTQDTESERFGPIRALLHLLDRCAHISVVISDASLKSRIDPWKVVRFIEQPPLTDAATIWRSVKALRDACLQDHPRTVIDPASKNARAMLTFDPPTPGLDTWLRLHADSPKSIIDAIAAVVQTPRTLKSALRLSL